MQKVLICCMCLLFATTGMAAGKNLVDLHTNAGKLSNKECLSCHADIKKDVTLNKKFKTFHRVHLESKLQTPKNCSDCHQSVELREGSAAALRKQVDPQLCAGCHSGGVKGANILFAQ
ncbi:MAG: hypothetical protein ACLPX5_05365 [Dissulfurispiraceae bacterium]